MTTDTLPAPPDIDALFEQAVSHHAEGRLPAAIALYDTVIDLAPDSAIVHSNRGAALCALNDHDAALASFDRAVTLMPRNAGAHNNRGNALSALKRFDEALASFDRAIALDSLYAEAHYNRANALKNMRRLDDALAGYDRAIALRPDHAAAYGNRGNTFKELNRWEEARTSYGTALALKPDSEFVPGALLYAKARLCDFEGFDAGIAALASGIAQGRRVCTPFQALAFIDSPQLQKRAAEIYAADLHSRCAPLPPLNGYSGHDRIRLGYFSADFHDHATMHLMAEFFERHDRSRFELTAFSFGPDRRDAMRARAERAFDRFIDVRHMTDRDTALLARELEIDIAVDLKGFTQGDRADIFAFGAAPVQVNFLGYPGTMGARFMHYILADAVVIPPGGEAHYSEKIVRLPHSYQPNDTARVISDRVFARADLGLPDDAFVFCCFNNSYKIAPAAFARWMRILEQVDDGMLWLLADNETAAGNLKREAERHGVAADRLIFAGRLPSGEHLARLRAADLFLDTAPYNAHTTASEALWVGLPVLTMSGRAFAGRVAASLLNAVGLPELVAATPEEYENRAIEFARNPPILAGLRKRLVEGRLAAPLFDTANFTRHVEAAYTAMHAGPRPAHIDVPVS